MKMIVLLKFLEQTNEFMNRELILIRF